MFFYEKKLQFPVKIATPNPKLAAFIISQYGGPYSNNLPPKRKTRLPRCPIQTSEEAGSHPVFFTSRP